MDTDSSFKRIVESRTPVLPITRKRIRCHLSVYKQRSSRTEHHRSSKGATAAAETFQKMANTQRSWIVFAALVICLLACWNNFADAYPPKPESPGSNASPEDWAKYQAAVRHYVNLITRQRYGKRSNMEEQAVEWLLFGPDSNQNPQPRADDNDDQW
ncbi:hypothetical protein fugu_001060 [Takifugu bimaculatus]|nr:hypothetical protein fugu_001060 [Takifugu bimaculatus]